MKELFLPFIVLAISFQFLYLKAETFRIPDDYPTIQAGIYAANEGDTILVSDGIYSSKGINNQIDFMGKAIVVISENGPENCILTQGDYVVKFISGEGNNSILSGFTISEADPGAAILCDNSSPTIINNIFKDNWSEYNLGVIELRGSSTVLISNLFYNNSVYGDCAGIMCFDNTNAIIINNTFFGGEYNQWQNRVTGVICDNTSNAEITNSILWNTGPVDFNNCTVAYSCFDKEISGISNSYIYPDFSDTLTYDYSLQQSSDCIDSGIPDTNGLNLPYFDLLGNVRIINNRIDMGAFEFQGETDITNYNDKPKIEVYPNPTCGLINISLNNLSGKTTVIEITNITGIQIFSEMYHNAAKISIDLSGNAKGVYLIKLIIDTEIACKKIYFE